MVSEEVVRQAVQASVKDSDDPLDHIADASEGGLGVVEALIAVWSDDELLNVLGRVDKHADSVTVSVDWQLVELLLAWSVGSESDVLRDGMCSGGRERLSDRAQRGIVKYPTTSDPGTLRSKSRCPRGSHAQSRPAQRCEPAHGEVLAVENNPGINPVTGQRESNPDRRRQFRNSTRAMIWASDCRRFAENAHRGRGDGERVGGRPAWAGKAWAGEEWWRGR